MINNELYHYGIKRRSGRYPYGSGKKPHQHEDGKSKVHGCLGVIGTISATLLGGVLISSGMDAVKDVISKNKARNMSTVSAFASDNKKQYMSITTDATKDVLSKTKLKLKKTSSSLYDDLLICNEDFDQNYEKWRNNCTKSCVANYLRRIGFDVKARSLDPKRETDGVLDVELYKLFPGFLSNTRSEILDSNDPIDQLTKSIYSTITDERAFGFFDVCFRGSKNQQDVFHYMTWEKIDGKVILSDPQTSSDKRLLRIFSYMDGSNPNVYVSRNVTWTRVDNIKMNPEQLSNFVSNR